MFYLCLIPIGVLYYNREEIIKTYQRWRTLNKTVEMTETNPFIVQYKSVQLYITSLFYNKQNNTQNVLQLDKKRYLLTYTIKGKNYKYITTVKKGPFMDRFTDENDTDVTENILSYYGPQRDWHNNIYTPHSLGYKSLNFRDKIYTENEPLIF